MTSTRALSPEKSEDDKGWHGAYGGHQLALDPSRLFFQLTPSPERTGSISRATSQTSLPLLRQPMNSVSTPLESLQSAYKTARMPPAGFHIPLSTVSSGPLFENTMSSMLESLHQISMGEQESEDDDHADDDSDGLEESGDEDHPAEKDCADGEKPGKDYDLTLDQVISKIFDEAGISDPAIMKRRRVMMIGVLSCLIVLVACCITLSSFPVLTCNKTGALCLAPLSIKLTDKTESAQSTMQTIREALKVLTYIVIDFGDTAGDPQLMNNRLDDYYQMNVIDSFNVNTTYELNVWGYCRTSDSGGTFCMRSYGYDIISVFVRDAGVQLGELTKTNTGIMGDSFAMLYELSIAGFNELVTREQDSGEYIDHAILLQKFSKGMGFLSTTQLVVNVLMFVGTVVLLLLVILSRGGDRKSVHADKIYSLKKYTVVPLTLLSFLGVTSGLIVLSFTYQYCLRLQELTSAVGIADVDVNVGFYLLWVLFIGQGIVTSLVVYVADCFRNLTL